MWVFVLQFSRHDSAFSNLSAPFTFLFFFIIIIWKTLHAIYTPPTLAFYYTPFFFLFSILCNCRFLLPISSAHEKVVDIVEGWVTNSDLNSLMGAKTNFEGCIRFGPWGGSKGKIWTYMPKGFIKKITIVHGRSIYSIKFHNDSSTDETEIPFFGDKGGVPDCKIDTIYLDYPNEYFTSICGMIDGCLTSLRFFTNQSHYGPYGLEFGSDTRFSFDGEGGVIVGFHGRVDRYLNAVGIYVMPESLAFGRNSTSEYNSMPKLCCSSISRMAMPREAGPWGGNGGKPWDDGVFSSVKEVRVHVGESLNVIYAIQFEYIQGNAKSVLSPTHGGTDGDTTLLVHLDGVDEYLAGISGFYGPIQGYKGLEAITSITFHTNKRKHGPYGEEIGEGYSYFTSTASPGKAVGFHGRSDSFLTAIGVHMKYF